VFEYFYHEILRKTVIGFGTLFNNVTIKHLDSSNKAVSVMKVPLAYGPIQKFLARLEQTPDLKGAQTITLPRMSFEFNGLSYDPSRKVTQTQTFITAPTSDKSTAKKVYMPVPYNMSFELNILAKLNDDALQIVEQILPYFQPSYNLTINLISSIGEKRDVPIVLDSVSFTDDYEGDFSERRALIYTLTFTAKTYLFGPVPSASTGIIKKATIDYSTRKGKDFRREVRYSVTPRATKDYTNDGTTYLAEHVTENETLITVGDASNLSVGDRIYVDTETIKISEIDGNNLVVKRAQDGTSAAEHGDGATVDLIDAADNALIDIGDDFGFNETTSFFQDMKVYSPSQDADVDA
jgi:hypothetical protein